MNYITIYAILSVALLFGCNKETKPVANESEVTEKEVTPVMKICVFKNGQISIEGKEISIDEAIALIQSADSKTRTCYYREAGQEDEPHPNAMKIIKAIVEAKLSIQLSTKPDFSTYIDANGIEHQNK